MTTHQIPLTLEGLKIRAARHELSFSMAVEVSDIDRSTKWRLLNEKTKPYSITLKAVSAAIDFLIALDPEERAELVAAQEAANG